LSPIVSLLWQVDHLRRLVSDLHSQPAADGGDRQVAVTEATDHVKRFARRLLHRQPRRVPLYALLDCRADLWRRSKETVRRHQPADALVRSLEVVCVDEELEPTLQVFPVGKHRARDELVPQRLPEALDLPERLRVLRPALDVVDSFAPQLFFEFRRAAPRGVLASLLRENFLRRSKRSDSSSQGLNHQR